MSTENKLTIEYLKFELEKRLCAKLLESGWRKPKSKTNNREYLIELIREYGAINVFKEKYHTLILFDPHYVKQYGEVASLSEDCLKHINAVLVNVMTETIYELLHKWVTENKPN